VRNAKKNKCNDYSFLPTQNNQMLKLLNNAPLNHTNAKNNNNNQANLDYEILQKRLKRQSKCSENRSYTQKHWQLFCNANSNRLRKHTTRRGISTLTKS